ncbi:hypothetical protein JCM9492_13380 [Aquifex pyrophilus]
MKLNEIIFVIYYNQYIELNQEELKKIINEIQNLNLSDKYKVQINEIPVVTQFDPIVTIEFVEGNKKNDWNNVFVKLSINPFQFQVSFVVNRRIAFPNEYLMLSIHSLENIIIKLWEAFNKVAGRKVIERLGLIANFNIPLQTYYSLISKCERISSEFKYVTLRLIDIFSNLKPFFENTKIVSNLFIELKLNAQLEPEEVFLINDIAIPPNTKGVIDISQVKEGFNMLIKISSSSIAKIYGRENG